jgi:hypothetical protein
MKLTEQDYLDYINQAKYSNDVKQVLIKKIKDPSIQFVLYTKVVDYKIKLKGSIKG